MTVSMRRQHIWNAGPKLLLGALEDENSQRSDQPPTRAQSSGVRSIESSRAMKANEKGQDERILFAATMPCSRCQRS
ncbi:hypothetical protein PoB_000829800 [Plakobranchus ocellatus]|uniref:Uncharacterized protein n=1 Tax=Plakobranchus ocellatus TaxID=259542 RepID=A0AAV3YHC0_9GAST|nr:hypothetical protein PoB_000829800 [Plakobranchus ocellatus]